MSDYRDKVFSEFLSASNPIEFFNNNRHRFKKYNLKGFLEALLKKSKSSKAKIIADSTLNTTYAYHIFAGNKNPSRDKVLTLSFAFKLNLSDTQELLRHAEAMELSAYRFRDAIIIFAIVNQYSLMKANSLLYELKEKCIE